MTHPRTTATDVPALREMLNNAEGTSSHLLAIGSLLLAVAIVSMVVAVVVGRDDSWVTVTVLGVCGMVGLGLCITGTATASGRTSDAERDVVAKVSESLPELKLTANDKDCVLEVVRTNKACYSARLVGDSTVTMRFLNASDQLRVEQVLGGPEVRDTDDFVLGPPSAP
jgi:hypothetical protein